MKTENQEKKKTRLPRVTRPMLREIAKQTEDETGRHWANLGPVYKWFKIEHLRGSEVFTVSFFGRTAGVALKEFERRLSVSLIPFNQIASVFEGKAQVDVPIKRS